MMKALSLVVVLAIFGSTFSDDKEDKPVKVNDCTCKHKGNVYEAYSADDCDSFRQSADSLPDGDIIKCLPGLKFDVNSCTCNYQDKVTCPAGCQGDEVTPATFDRSNVTCIANGNTYTLVPGKDCKQFEQVANDGTGQKGLHDCPGIQGFDVDTCVCNLPTRFVCPV